GLFGPVVGTLVVVAGSNGGAAMAFLIARYLARRAVENRVSRNPRLGAMDRAISRNGALVVALLRLSPVIPFNVQNYFYGIAGIGFWTCSLISSVAMLPGTILYVWLGYTARKGLEAASGSAESRSTAEWAFRIVGVLAFLTLSALATAWARRELRETVGEPVKGSHEDGNEREIVL
ncbi:MAG TPA: TVP38/TMEM64 family protein, partial [Isosphaeraceae bacterium]|nr:TVP38/TMEM64 family protein [Isosphaeraceae bacterium]